MFGSYRINERKTNPRLSFQFKGGELNFYNCSVKIIPGRFNDVYDEEKDVMSEKWNPKKATSRLKAHAPAFPVCDALLDQEIFAGVGNIIKNEVLFRIRIHPESEVHSLPVKMLQQLVREARTYCFDFYKWKKQYELKKHWLIYRKKLCPRCNIPVARKYIGIHPRLSFYCENCQALYQ